MNEVLTIQLRDSALADFVRRRAAEEQRTPESLVEDALRAMAEAERLTLIVAPELDGWEGTAIRDQDETDEQFARRQESFRLLMGRP
ncbi:MULTISPECIES: hypothetical protein [Roseomonadaceae]|uniref:CopG family transcriptional regulator n=1 Tax=Falsiroseomonas oleicola TaxID=2801474 RepID=A0ABS6H982_9PROT|nr:hypothetical protein [Roseomonas oleicola]MBU8545270.1 hypothetical protein [Roseomonas oleicola]